MPIALVTQTMPLVALTPLLVLIFGRGIAVTIAITISVTFFPAYVTLAQGLALVPRAAFDLPRAYGASALAGAAAGGVPAHVPYLFAAARLTVPRALLGVMIAEWLATGTRPRQPPQPVARLSRLRHDLDGGARLGPASRSRSTRSPAGSCASARPAEGARPPGSSSPELGTSAALVRRATCVSVSPRLIHINAWVPRAVVRCSLSSRRPASEHLWECKR